MKKDEKIPNSLTKLMISPTVKSVFADGINFTKKEDGTCTMIFHHKIGEDVFEQARVVITNDHLIKMADVICKLTNYYPQNPKQSATQRKK